MTAALEGGEWSAARPGRTLSPGKTRYSFYRRLGGPQGRSGRAENLVSTGIRSRTVQSVTQSLYRLSYPARFKTVLFPKITAKIAAGATGVTVSVFITSTGAVSGHTKLPADHKFSVFIIFRAKIKMVPLLRHRDLSEAVRQTGTHVVHGRQIGQN